MLERAGFAINGNPRGSTLELVDPVLYQTLENTTPMRLSSITNFPSMSQPELSCQGQLRQVGDPIPVDAFSNYSLRRTESVPAQNLGHFLPATTISQPPVELNPYNHFASDRASATSPYPDPYSRNRTGRGLNVANNSNGSSSWEFLSDRNLARPQPVLDLQRSTRRDNGSTRSSLAVEQLDADALSKASDFRHFMPQARRLPFTQTKRKIEESNTKRKAQSSPNLGAEIGKDTTGSPPTKKKRNGENVTEAQTKAKCHPQKAQRSKNQATSSRKVETRKGTTAAKKAIQKTSPTRKADKSSTPRTTMSVQTSSPEKGSAGKQKGKGKGKEKRQPDPATKGTAKRGRPRKQVAKTTPTNKIFEPSKQRKPAKTSSPSSTTASKTSLVEEPRASGDSAAGASAPHLHSQVDKIIPRIIVDSDPDLNFPNDDSSMAKAECDATLLITESTVLDALNKMTWKIIDQYEADLDCGLNRFEIAQYYVDNLHNTRFEFWHDRLAELGSVSPLHVRQPIS